MSSWILKRSANSIAVANMFVCVNNCMHANFPADTALMHSRVGSTISCDVIVVIVSINSSVYSRSRTI